MSGGKAGDYANILWYLNQDKFNFVGLGDWTDVYYFDGVRWCRDHVYFREWIREELPKIFMRLKDKIGSNKKAKKTFKQLMDGLKSPAMDKNIKDRVAGIYQSKNPDFKNLLDTKRNLLGFKNGVYDLDKDLFREGDSDDYITMSVGYDYPGSQDNKDLLRFLEDIQPDRDQREYLLKFTASCLFGGNREETFHIFSGSGRNGKSK